MTALESIIDWAEPELPKWQSDAVRRLLIPEATSYGRGAHPADILCGQAIGARAIAVATGRYPAEELARHHPYALFPSLADTQEVMRVIVDA